MLAVLTAEQTAWAIGLAFVVSIPVVVAAIFGTVVLMDGKGYGKPAGFVLGILLPILGLLVAALLPDRGVERPPPRPGGISTKRKLAITALLMGGTFAFLQTALLFIVSQADNEKKVESQEVANASAEATNADLQDQYDRAVAARDSGEVVQSFVSPDNQSTFDAGSLDQAALDALKTEIVDIDWSFRNGWIITVLWITLWTVLPLLAAFAVLWFRDDGLPITWAESMLYAGTMFWYFIVVWAMIPHLMMRIWDDVAEITGTFTVFPTQWIGSILNPDALGWQWDWFVVRDMIVAGWYVVTLVAMFALWWWAQEMPKRAAAKQGEIGVGLRSPYGRPVLTAGR